MNRPNLNPNQSILALDIGDARIGLARAGAIARLPEPLETISNDDKWLNTLKQVIERENIGLIVVGLPRNLSGDETAQTQNIRTVASKINAEFDIDMVFCDESLSSKRADEYLKTNKTKDISQDSIAACYILEEYLMTKENN